MFTGLVEEIGVVAELAERAGGWSLGVRAARTVEGTRLGDSVAVNGTCLTVTHLDGGLLTFGLSPETLRRTNLGELEMGSPVNLERSLSADGRIGGHFVQGHVDGTGVIRQLQPDGDSLWVTVGAAPELLRYIVPKGYVTVDGASLTVVEVLSGVEGLADAFTFMLVAYTRAHITLPSKVVGSRVNLEVDILGKYVENFLRKGTDGARPH